MAEKLLNRVNWLLTFISVVLAILVGLSEESSQKLFSQEINKLTYFLLLASCSTVLILSTFLNERVIKKLKTEIEIRNLELKNEREDNRKTKLKLENTNRLIYDINIEKNTDVITGIPNQLMFQEDVIRISNSIKQGELFQIILIDIDNFGSVNQKYGYFKGDSLIRAIAEELYYSMRRNENVYKNKFIEFDEALTETVYRKYNGGDEFIILIKGSQEDAIGFVTRLSKQLKRFSEKTNDTIGEYFSISFHAGIAPLFANDNSISALARVEECYRIAKRKDSELKIKWFKNVVDFQNILIYKAAMDEFRKK